LAKSLTSLFIEGAKAQPYFSMLNGSPRTALR